MSNSLNKIIPGISGLNLSQKLNTEAPLSLLFFLLSFSQCIFRSYSEQFVFAFFCREIMHQNGEISGDSAPLQFCKITSRYVPDEATPFKTTLLESYYHLPFISRGC